MASEGPAITDSNNVKVSLTNHEVDGKWSRFSYEQPSLADFLQLSSNLNESHSYYVLSFLVESCERLFTHGRRSNGFYYIHKPDIVPLPLNQSYIQVWCDMDGPNGGWILLQQRENSTFNFYRNWVSYEEGFGKPGVGYWLGNKYMHSITFKRKYVLRIELPGYYDELTVTLLAEYDNFQVLSPSSGYVLKVGNFRGGLGNILFLVNNTAFSTWDRDNDKVDAECAKTGKGAWWYGKTCNVYDMNTMQGFLRMKMKVKEDLKGNVRCFFRESVHYKLEKVKDNYERVYQQ